MPQPDFSRLERAIEEMPAFVRDVLTEAELIDIYKLRPAYQQNDYLSWIRRAKRPETKQRRLAQMLDELRAGDVYMNMAWKPKRTPPLS